MAMRRTLLSMAVIYLIALGGVVLADPPTTAIQQNATLITGAVVVSVVANCGDSPSEAFLDVGVRQGDLAMETLIEFVSTGNRQVVTVTVPGPFTVGNASASAQLACSTLF